MLPTRLLARIATVLAMVAALLAIGAAPVQAHGRPAHHGPKRPPTVDLRMIGINDLHGNLEPPAGSSGRVAMADGSTVDAGGVAYLATHLKALRSAAPHSLFLSAGDNIGASPLTSALFHDEPTIDVLNAMHLDASVVGNHELDEGYPELQRIQRGGCHPTDGCQFDARYRGARFPFLGANITFDDGRPAVLPFTVKVEGGIPVGIIGITLHDLPSVVTPSAIAGLKFGDEVQAIDRTSALLQRFGVRAQVVLMHQGADIEGPEGPNDCNLNPAAEPALTIARAATPNVDALFTGHSHTQYDCTVQDPAGKPRPVIQGASFGRLLSVVDVKLSRRTRDVIRADTVARNEVVTRTVTPDPTVQAIVDRAVTKSAPLANRAVGSITADLVRAAPSSGEEPIGDVIADAQLAGTADAGAQIAITNPGGIRADLVYAGSSAGEGDGVVTYGEAFTVQPFANIMQTITLTGAQLKAVLEQQWQGGVTKVLQISSTLHYSYSASAPEGSKVSDITVAGAPVDATTSYRVSVNNFLAAGGDGFTVFAQGADLVGGPVDLDAFTAYLTAHPNLSPPPADRVSPIP